MDSHVCFSKDFSFAEIEKDFHYDANYRAKKREIYLLTLKCKNELVSVRAAKRKIF